MNGPGYSPEDGESFDFGCDKCGVHTNHKTGLCAKCRTINCSKCGTKVQIRNFGQELCFDCSRRKSYTLNSAAFAF